MEFSLWIPIGFFSDICEPLAYVSSHVIGYKLVHVNVSLISFFPEKCNYCYIYTEDALYSRFQIMFISS